MNGAGPAFRERRGVIAVLETAARRLHAVKGDLPVAHEPGKQPDSVGAAAHAGDHRVRQAAGHFKELAARLAPYYGLEIPHHHGERVRPHHRTNGVELVDGVFKVGLEGGVDGIFQRSRA